MENVRHKLYTLKRENGQWNRQPLDAPAFGAVSVDGIDSHESDDYFMTVANFLTPSSLFYGTLGRSEREKLKSLPAFFNPDGLEIGQHETKSKDGTRDSLLPGSGKGIALDGNNPTLLYGYGGFEISMLPNYSAGVGSAWLERGGVYILATSGAAANLVPSGTTPPEKRIAQRAYEDFIAVAEDWLRAS